MKHPQTGARGSVGRVPSTSELMSHPVQTVRADASAREAASLMRGSHIQHLVVLDAEDRVVGVISDRDLRAAQPSQLLVADRDMREKALSLLKVHEVMSAHPHTVRPDAPITQVLNAMRRERIGCVPVVTREGEVCGVVTGGDVVLLALSLLEA